MICKSYNELYVFIKITTLKRGIKMVSVAMAVYNGGEYIRVQLDSVLSQLDENDEVVISDDLPSGNTRKAIEEILINDKRVKYIHGPQKGVIKNFENAIKHTNGDWIFLCDQDDVWLPGKVEAVVDELKNGALVVMHDAKIVDENLNVTENSFFKWHSSSRGYYKNILKNSYIGCCMAFSGKLKDFILPFPDDLPMHDQWIGLIGEKTDKVKFLNQPYLLYRRHSATVTGGKTGFLQKIKWRIDIIRCITGKQVNL